MGIISKLNKISNVIKIKNTQTKILAHNNALPFPIIGETKKQKENIMTQKEKYWSRFANDFEELNNYVVGKSDMTIILNKLSKQKGLKNTIELGCGNGTYSKVLAKETDNLLATDFSEEMVNAARGRLKSIANIKIEKANCFNLPYPDNNFDTVFMANLLHIIPKPENAIAESKRVLKNQGGRIIVIDFTPEGMTFFNKLGLVYRYLKTYGKPPSKRQGQNLTVKKIRELLENTDFKIEEAKLIGNKVKAVFIIAKN